MSRVGMAEFTGSLAGIGTSRNGPERKSHIGLSYIAHREVLLDFEMQTTIAISYVKSPHGSSDNMKFIIKETLCAN